MRTIDATQGIRILDSRSTATLLSKVLWITTVGFLFTALGAYLAPALLGGLLGGEGAGEPPPEIVEPLLALAGAAQLLGQRCQSVNMIGMLMGDQNRRE